MITADKVLLTAALFTGATQEARPGAVAIVGKEIAAVGAVEEVQGLIGDDTQVIDCGDRLVMPGLNDSHLHLLMGAIQSNENQCLKLLGTESEEQCARLAKEFADAHPENEWIFGCGWTWQSWTNPQPPTSASLDALEIDRPVCLNDLSLHAAWLNSRAMEVLGISADTVIEGGVVRKDENGQPTGVLDDAASQLALKEALKMDAERLSASIGELIPKLNSMGITAVSDMFPLLVACEDPYEGYRKAVEERNGSLRITFYSDAKDIKAAKEYAARYTGDYVRFGGVKFVTDGCVENQTAFMKEPYLDGLDPEFRSEMACSKEELDAMVLAADREGFAFRAHAIGDGTAATLLDALERACDAYGYKALRNCLEHTDNIASEDIERMSRLGVSAAVQPAHTMFGGLAPGLFDSMIGLERTARMWPYREELDAGVVLGMGTDWPCAADINPFVNLLGAVCRTTIDCVPAEGWYRENCMTLGEALQGYTRGSAYVEGFEDRIGLLSPGKLADIVVMDRNPFEMDPLELKDMKAALTIFDGRIVYHDEELIEL